jgi:hypothetical protein
VSDRTQTTGLAADGHAADHHLHGRGDDDHGHGQEHAHGHDNPHGHGHKRHKGLKGWLYELFVPHAHDAADSVDDALEAGKQVAFILGRRAATRRYTYGFGRAEDRAGLSIVAVVACAAMVEAWQSMDRLIHPQALQNGAESWRQG